MVLEEVIFNKYFLTCVLAVIVFLVARALVLAIGKPIMRAMVKKKNRAMEKNCKDCKHFYYDNIYNCHCDIMEIAGICDPNSKACYRK
jgi:hypothetical protein